MKKHTLNIKSDIHELPEIERFIENVCDYYNLNNNYFGNIMVAVNEAVENAIIHGNENNANKTVSLQFELVPSGILFTIEDEGTGFDFNSIPDATDIEKNPEKKGTGIYLIKALADDVKFLSKGRKIQLTFNITSINKEVFINRKQLIDKYLKVKKGIFEKNK
ncbi:MAG: ATP-binding protein [Bacteroidales bacterium]|jgi:serine/threonine-protein kinase RsbW|nr:ATP-binding protein [Bacteroidales bacterium]MDD4213203.1 ATP-binding protein [Bacteroidales bacterium]